MNWLKTTIRRIVPPPHRPVRWTAAIPLMVFAVLFALVVFSILPTFTVTHSRRRWDLGIVHNPEAEI
jgi:hypothetical protein